MEDTLQVRRFRTPSAGWLLVIGLLLALAAVGSIVEVQRRRTQAVVQHVHALGGVAVLESNAEWLERFTGAWATAMLQRVVRVELSNSRAGDADLLELARHNDLKLIYLLGANNVTPAGIEALEQARPELIFIRTGSAFMGIGGSGDPQGLAVRMVLPDSPAAAAGISAGDIIAEFDGVPVADMSSLVRRVAACQPGETVPILLVRHRGTEIRTVTLGEWK